MNNFSSFVYDGMSRNISIVETTAGSVTSTKQFVWAQDKMRPYQPSEERDGSGALTKKFFVGGQMNSSTKYFYERDHLGSIRELTDNSGVVQAQYAFDPFGRVTKISETVASDFGYAGYYLHSRSALYLSLTRTYNPILGRFLSRDPLEEGGGNNNYAFVFNNPLGLVDPSGLLSNPTGGTASTIGTGVTEFDWDNDHPTVEICFSCPLNLPPLRPVNNVCRRRPPPRPQTGGVPFWNTPTYLLPVPPGWTYGDSPAGPFGPTYDSPWHGPHPR